MSILFRNRLGSGIVREMRVRELLRYQTAMQKVAVYESRKYGRMLALDDELQLATEDEALYHSTLVEPAMELMSQLSPCGFRVIILGGADGFALRRVLEWDVVKSAVVVDHDRELVDLFANGVLGELFGTMNAFSDSRVIRVHTDAWAYIEGTSFDDDTVVVVDLTDGWWAGGSGVALSKVTPTGVQRVLVAANVGADTGCLPEWSAWMERLGFYIIAGWSLPIGSFGEPWLCGICAPAGWRPELDFGRSWRKYRVWPG